jgi:ubiquinone/menaquinone biosynthesis C-methylase UbiE
MKYIRKELCNYVGIDIVEELIQTNKELYETDTIKFVCTDFLSYLGTLPDASVDLILCRHTCEHLPKDYIFDFFFECQRVAKFLLLTTKKTPPGELCNQELDLTKKIYRPLNFDLPPFAAFFKPYFVKELYDGPAEVIDPEMFIYLYKFRD